VAKYYIDRWKEPLKALESLERIRPVHLIDEMSERDEVPTRHRSSSTYMQWIVRLTVAFWLGLLGVYSVQWYARHTMSAREKNGAAKELRHSTAEPDTAHVGVQKNVR